MGKPDPQLLTKTHQLEQARDRLRDRQRHRRRRGSAKRPRPDGNTPADDEEEEESVPDEEEQKKEEAQSSDKAKQPDAPRSTPTVPHARGSVGSGLKPVVELKEPPSKYGAWYSTIGQTSTKPRVLIVFSGRPREGDLAHQLARLGWAGVLPRHGHAKAH